jgi:hypothetical protein
MFCSRVSVLFGQGIKSAAPPEVRSSYVLPSIIMVALSDNEGTVVLRSLEVLWCLLGTR